MKQIILISLGTIAAVSAVVIGYTYTQVNEERLNLSADLRYRTRLLSDSLKESIEPNLTTYSTTTLARLIGKFADRERIVGLAVFNSGGVTLAASEEIPKRVTENPDFVFESLNRAVPIGRFEEVSGVPLYLFVSPLMNRSSVSGALVMVQNTAYIEEALSEIWKQNLYRLFLQILIFSAAIVLLIRFALVRIMRRFADSVKSTRVSRGASTPARVPFFLRPVASEITKMGVSLAQARFAASEEARMRMEKLDSPWTAERLKAFVSGSLKDRSIFVVSNLEPYIHRRVNDKIEYVVPPSGLVTALNPVMEACGGTWIARSYGNADKETVDTEDRVAVPPDDPKYTLKRLWLTQKQVEGYHAGFSNEGLWPLCLMVHTRPVFRKDDWEEYTSVNTLFGESVLREIKQVSEPIVFIQDYHLSLLPRLVKETRPDALVVLFWHLPWPSAEQFSICPYRKEILLGMLGADLIGFHTQQYGNNFLDTIGKEIEARIDLEQFAVIHRDHASFVKTFPLSINFTGSHADGRRADTALLKEFNIKTPLLGLGVDKMDYVKGIIERFQGVEHFLRTHPSYRRTFTFLQIAPLCRTNMEIYRTYEAAVTAEAARINKNLGTNDWNPIVLVKKEYSHAQLTSLYRLAHILAVTSLHEGMNLVAKEFIAARDDEEGTLILSPFAGAARELREALIVNPYDTVGIGTAIHTALTMPKTEQRRRMKILRNTVKNQNIYRWAAELLKAVTEL